MAYASGTKVPIERTQEEIRRLLKRYGSDGFALAEKGNQIAIQFVFDGLPYRFIVEEPDQEALKKAYYDDKYQNTSLSDTAIRRRMQNIDWNEHAQAEVRRRWRARLLWLKATLEFADTEGRDVLRQALMSQLVLPDGRTMDQWASRQLPEIYSTGQVPALPMFDE